MQTRADLFEAELPLPPAGNYVLSLANAEVSWTQPVAVQSSAELSALQPDPQLLQRAAQLGGGRFDPAPEEIFRRPQRSPKSYQSAFEPLLQLALLLLLAEVALRRWPSRSVSLAQSAAPTPEAGLDRLRSQVVQQRQSKATRPILGDLTVTPVSPSQPAAPESNAREELRKIRQRRRGS